MGHVAFHFLAANCFLTQLFDQLRDVSQCGLLGDANRAGHIHKQHLLMLQLYTRNNSLLNSTAAHLVEWLLLSNDVQLCLHRYIRSIWYQRGISHRINAFVDMFQKPIGALVCQFSLELSCLIRCSG